MKIKESTKRIIKFFVKEHLNSISEKIENYDDVDYLVDPEDDDVEISYDDDDIIDVDPEDDDDVEITANRRVAPPLLPGRQKGKQPPPFPG